MMITIRSSCDLVLWRTVRFTYREHVLSWVEVCTCRWLFHLSYQLWAPRGWLTPTTHPQCLCWSSTYPRLSRPVELSQEVVLLIHTHTNCSRQRNIQGENTRTASKAISLNISDSLISVGIPLYGCMLPSLRCRPRSRIPSSLSYWSPPIPAWPARRHRPSLFCADRAAWWRKQERGAMYR
jgi:hypothetical protein